MPFNDYRSESLNEFIDILDIITSHLETASAPSILVGDWNTCRPQMKHISQAWYRTKAMSTRSVLLYDFICSNEMAVANFTKKQTINHTYAKGAQRSYIDHILVPRHMVTDKEGCEIKQHMDNASDHYAIVCVLKINIEPCSTPYEVNHSFPNTQWFKSRFCDRYRSNLQSTLDSQMLMNPDLIPDNEAQKTIDSLDNTLTKAMHSAAKESAVKQGQQKSTHWWTTECTQAKSKNRFWYRLWCDNDKPTHGVIYECYKGIQTSFQENMPNIPKELY